MGQTSFVKKLFPSNLGEAGMHDRYITIPIKADPPTFFGNPPQDVLCIDKTTGSLYQFPFSRAANGEYRLTQFGSYFEDKNAVVDDEVIIEKITIDSSIEYRIDLMKNASVINVNKSLRQFALDVFVLSCKEFGQEFLIKHLTDSNSGNIDGKDYKAIRFPDYFSNTNMLAAFNEKQNKQSLTTGKSQRFSEENIKILDEDYIYFNFQWSHPKNSSSADFYELKKFIEDWTNLKYKLVFLEIDGKKNYRLVLNSQSEQQLYFDINSFKDDCKNAGLVYTDQLITRFVSSLLTKPFVILTGLSGSGKTKLAQAYVQWICQDESQYRIIPVGADWTNREPLLGYPNALKPEEYVKPDSGVIDLIIQANSNPELPHFLILDEMNLSHVERYFADFLSVMESNEEIPLYAEGTVDNGVPSKLKVPANLFIIGTVNIDETTNMFSPKVLDRANTIEFRIDTNEMEGFLDTASNLNMKALLSKGANMAQNFIGLANNKSFALTDREKINNTLLKFFVELQKTGAEFGYRSASEILRLINQLGTLDDSLSTNEKVDYAIMQKLLPKLHGSRRKLSPILETLGGFCVKDKKVVLDKFRKEDYTFKDEDVLYPLSLEKISRMYKGAVDNGFASYAEA